MIMDITYEMIVSWANTAGTVNSTKEILQWIEEKNKTINVNIKKINLDKCSPWYYDIDKGVITNQNQSFFCISGFQQFYEGKLLLEQPIILQNEIGYLGIICKKINGVLNFLMQAKIEPGNINKVQLSPTIQATRSNFSQKHGGRKPPYLDYFLNASKYSIIVDQIQSEQSSRFYKKRNRNIIILVNEDVKILPSHKWMTLGQIKELMKLNNIVNMDARTVLACIPYSKICLSDEEKKYFKKYFSDSALFESIFSEKDQNIPSEIYYYINNYKMFDDTETKLVPLHELKSWMIEDDQIICPLGYSFKVIFCDIAIEGREVLHWTQPLFEAIGHAMFGLIMCDIDGVCKFLVHAMPEAGCYDKLELGPSVQIELDFCKKNLDPVEDLFFRLCNDPVHVILDVMLSEEGGRFYCEENRNVLIRVTYDQIPDLPEGYFFVDYQTLNRLVQINNCLNIQLRNLLSLLEV